MMGGSTRGGASPNNRRRLYLIWRRGTSRSRRCGRWLDEDRRPSAARSTPASRDSCSSRGARQHPWSSPGRRNASSRRSPIAATPRGVSNCSCRMSSTRRPPKRRTRPFWRPWTPPRAARLYVDWRGSAARGRRRRACGTRSRRCCRRSGRLVVLPAPTSARPPSTGWWTCIAHWATASCRSSSSFCGRTRCGSWGRTCTARGSRRLSF
mmetsp:Transcript_4772/g.14407  ORF Transcript_4772/g.14407 Transcript_4772/m.14407 type:complete len:209 (-) Transcript_4772:30-656(-)